MASFPVEWGSYAISVGQADVIAKNSNLDIVVESTPGAIIEAVATGVSPFAAGESIFNLTWAYNGEDKFADLPWTPATNLRALVSSELWNFAFLTIPGSGVESLLDLEGTTIPIVPWISTTPQFLAIIEASGIDLENDVNIQTTFNTWDEVHLGRMSMSWDIPNIEILQEQEKSGELVFLPVSADAFEKAKAANPLAFAGVSQGKLNPDDVPGLKISEPKDIVKFVSVIFGNTDLSDDAAYQIVTSLVKNYEKVQSVAFGVSEFSPETAAPVISTFPYHPGAIKAYKDLGLWTAAHEEGQKGF